MRMSGDVGRTQWPGTSAADASARETQRRDTERSIGIAAREEGPLSATYDLQPAAQAVAELLPAIADDQLTAPTPCPDYRVRDLLFHVLGLSVAFRDAARKDLGPTTATAPSHMTPELPAQWRSAIPARLDELAAAWREPDAWEGMTQAGGVTLPASVAGQVALNELVVHGWDLARATGQAFDPAESAVRGSYEMLAASTEPAQREPIFGPVVPVPDEAPLLDRAIGLSGRDPAWPNNNDHDTGSATSSTGQSG